jgi:predicted transcriptional regulator
VQDIIIELKKEEILQNFRVGSKDYWIKKNKKVLVISAIKQKYLKALATSKSTKELSAKFNVCWKAAFRRLKELENLGLVIQCENKQWKLKPHNLKVIVK